MVYYLYPQTNQTRLFTEKCSKSKIPYLNTEKMREMYPGRDFVIIGEIGNFTQPIDCHDVLLTNTGKEVFIFPRGSHKKPFEWIAGYAQVGENKYIAVVRSIIPYCLKWRRCMKKIISIILVVLMVLQMATPAFALTSDTMNNTMQENQTILEKLKNLYGEGLTEDDIVNELSNMGLLDEEGDLNVSESIMVDGTPMTLEQVKQLIYGAGADLSRVVSVDGTELTLADLKIMIEIEEELARIKKEYFSDAVPLTDEHVSLLESFLKQVQDEGIMLQASSLGAEPYIEINHNARIRTSLSSTGLSSISSEYFPVTITFELLNENSQPLTLDYDVSFKVRTLDGSAKDGINYSGINEAVTVPAGTSVVTRQIKIFNTTNDPSASDKRWNGDKFLAVQVYDPVNILFEGNTSCKDMTIYIRKLYNWDYVNDNVQIFDQPFDLATYTIPAHYNTNRTNINRTLEDIGWNYDNTNASFEYFLNSIRLETTGSVEYALNFTPQILNSRNEVCATTSPSSIRVLCPDSAWPNGSSIKINSSEWPEYFVFSNPTFNSPFPVGQSITYSIPQSRVTIIDKKAPAVKSITANAGSYYSGQKIPVVVEFSEPVNASNVMMNIDGKTMSSLENNSLNISLTTFSKYATFLYTVPNLPNNSLYVDSVNYITDLKNNYTASWPSSSNKTLVQGVTMQIDPLMAFKDIVLANEPDDKQYSSVDTIEVKLNVDTEVSQWLENDYDINGEHLNSVFIKANNITYPLVMGGDGSLEGSYYSAYIPAKSYTGITSNDIKIELYINGTFVAATEAAPAHFTGGTPVIGKSITSTVAPVVLISELMLDTSSYPENNKIYLTAETSTQLKASINPLNATFKDITWESSNDSVATIDETTGVITAVSPGVVKFRALALNGGFSEPITAETPEITVADGGPPAIVFPLGNNAFYTRKNETVNILWSQNLINRTEGITTEFTVEIFDGYYLTKESVEADKLVYNSTATDTNKLTIPDNLLSKVSADSAPAYTVKVSSVNPDNTSEILSAIGYIIVYPQPAKVKLSPLDSYYITDKATRLDIDWMLSDFMGGSFEFKVTKNGTEIYTDTSTNSTGSYSLNISPVAEGTLKDIYTVTIKAKNAQDSGWSTDSFVLNVYDKDSMKIMSDNEDVQSVTMDNNSYISDLYKNFGSEGILALNRDISLKKFIGINYSQYPWGNITDQIKWKSDNSNVASVNYKQGTLYENIEKFEYTSYRPSTEFMLAGKQDGTATITATHAASGMQDTLEVDVTTMKDKLYLFNFYPKQETELDYINGNGVVIKLKTNNDGQIAIYEESGINSNISLRSGNESNLYLGTLYHDKLITSEGDPGKYDLYPVNIFELRPTAKVELFFKDSQGKPYSSNVTYRGAVYKNGEICSETMEKDGKNLDIGPDGRFTLNFDSTKFWTENNSEKLFASDKLEFIYEVVFNDNYYPQLIKVNGNIGIEETIKFGESVVNLKEVSEEDKNKPFVVSQEINYNLPGGRLIDVTIYKGLIGPSNLYPSLDLETTVAWWGQEKKDGYNIKVVDEYGGSINCQKIKTYLYPFASLSYTKNITTMSKDSLELNIGETKDIFLNLSDQINLLKTLECKFSLTNMYGAPSADDETKGVKKAVEDLDKSGDLEFDGSMVKNGDNVVGLALDLMSGTTLGGPFMNLKIIATEDPTIFKGLITMQQGMGSTDASDVTVEIGGVESSLNYTPDAAEMMDLMLKSSDDIGNDLAQNMEKSVIGGIDYGVNIKGYFEVEVRYDFKAGKWIMVVVGGGFDLDALFGASVEINAMAGPVPVTAEFGIGATTKLEFRAVKPYGNVPANVNAADVNDFFTALRIKMYISAFGGFGFDYSVVALKIGVFGKINLDYDLEFVNRSYLSPPPYGYGQLYGIELGLSGQVGIKFVAKFLFISYEAVLASYEYTTNFWTEGNPELVDEWKDKQTAEIFGFRMNNQMSLYGLTTSIRTVKEGLNLEDRDYLQLYDRSWGGSSLRRALSVTGVTEIQSNSYPYANPVATRDGNILAYMSDSNSTDLNETRASWAIKGAAGYEDKGALPQPSPEVVYADNNIKIDGTKDFAAAAWEKQGIKIVSDGSASSEDIKAMISSSEIIASIYDGSSWHTTALTDNMVSDMSPVVAANGGRAVVAWRSLAGSSSTVSGLSYDDVNDSIMYKVYENGSWSDEIYTLYNNSSGNVKGLSAAMLEDGTTAVTYTLDYGTENTNSAYGFETVCALIGKDNNVITDIRLTNDDSSDQNPQVTAVDFGAEGEKFVVGWYSVTQEGVSDIKLAAIDNSGSIYSGFIDSISSINENSAVNITDTFRFVKGENLNLDDLSIIWVEPTLEYNDELNKNAENDCIKAVKFMISSNGRIYLTAALDVATMDDYTLIDHLDAYSNADNSVNAVMLCSSYDGQLEDQGYGVYTVDSISSMKYASATYENNIEVDDIYINYKEIKNNFSLPLKFTATNMGITPINSISISLKPDNAVKTFENLNLLPNESAVLTVDYDVPDEIIGIHDLNYTLTASFSDGGSKEKTGLLNLDIPDTGIAKVELVSDEQGKRVVQLTLNNLSDIELKNSSNRKIYAGMYTSPEFINESIVGVEEITGSDLELLDEGALTERFTYNVSPGGVPSGGVRLYARVWVEENVEGKYEEIIEYNPVNNKKSILIPNPIEANNGNQFLVTIEQENDVDNSKVRVKVKNLAMTPSVNGNVIAYLMDVQGNIIETKFLAMTADELLELGGEESITKNIVFTKLGTRVVAEYFTADPNNMVPAMAHIKLNGIAMNFDSSVTDYSLNAVNLDNTVVMAIAKNSNHTVEIRNAMDNKLLATGKGTATYQPKLTLNNILNLKVIAVNEELGTVSNAYRINITNSQKSRGNVILTTLERNYNSAKITVKAENLADFIPVKWQFMKDGVWSEVFAWNNENTNEFTLNETGTYSVMARLFDENGYYMDSNSTSIIILRRSSNNDNVVIPVDPGIVTGTFKDVAEGYWYYEAIEYLASKGIINGVGNGMFAPEDNIKRADFLIMVMNAYGLAIDDDISDNFDDAGDEYYTKYLSTARRIGLVSGVGNNMFAPENLITRQDMTVILYRILLKLGKLPESMEGISIDDFMDTNDIADYALDAMRQFVEGSTISGYENRLYPSGLTTRAQAAQILYNLLK